MKSKNDFLTKLSRVPDGKQVIIKFKKGDRWSYLKYGAEGSFLIRFLGNDYNAEQTLYQNSTEVRASEPNSQPTYDEWLKLKCANAAVGWVLLREVEDSPGFARANVFEYGGAADTFVQMKEKGGAYVVPVTINGAITLDFVVDSGAADVSVPADVVLTLVRTGTIKGTDFVGKREYRLADGSTVPSATFRIASLKVAGHKIEGVLGSVSSVRSTLLLGQSFLGRFKSWSVDNRTHTLHLDR